MREQKMYFKFLTIVLCLLSFSVCADSQMEMVQDKLDRLEADLALVQRKLYQQPLSSSVATTTKATGNIDELYAQIDAQNQVVQDLTAQLEQISHKLTTLSDQFNRMQQDTDFRFNNLNENKPQEINKTPTISDTKLSDKEAYEKAYGLLKDGQYEQAEQSFLNFMEKYPDSALLGNANYWLAESYYARQKWAEAAGLFADGFTKYKDNAKAPDSMFKLGLTMKQMGKTKEACTAFKNLNKEFKDLADHLKKRADQEVKELKCP